MKMKTEERLVIVAEGVAAGCIGMLAALSGDTALPAAVGAIVEIAAFAVLVVMARNLYRFRDERHPLLRFDRLLFTGIALGILIYTPLRIAGIM